MKNLQEIAQLFGIADIEPVGFSGFCIDSRQITPGNLFVALIGEHFDGHDFILNAAQQGAVAILCERANPQVSIPQLVVSDTIKALGVLATAHRQSMSCPIIALTGSNGKTTVKEMIAAILPQPAYATFGNLNNHIGVPLSVLQLNNQYRYAVFELGANHPHEIAYTAGIVKPQVALINNIAPAHIEGFGSIDGVATSKGEIYEALPNHGTAIVNEDDDYAHFWDNLLINKQVLRFSLQKPVDVYAKNIDFNQQNCATFDLILPSGHRSITLRTPGEHAVSNALAAATSCYAAGVELDAIAAGLSQFTGVAGRLTFLTGKNQSLIIDDTYNANLRSVLAAIQVLSKRSGRRILVLGDMGELGAWTKQHHEELGRAAQSLGIECLMTCGIHTQHTAKAFGAPAKHYTSQEKLVQDLLTQLDANTTVLVKGSRSAAMEKVVHQVVA